MTNATEAYWRQITQQIDAAKIKLNAKEYKSLLEAIEARAERELDEMDEPQDNEDEITT